MAISILNSVVQGGGSEAGITFTENAGAAQNDIMLAVLVRGSNTIDGAFSAPADFGAALFSKTETIGNNDLQIAVYAKRRGATVGNGYAFPYSGTAAGMTGALMCIRGVDTTNMLDVAIVEASHYLVVTDDATTAAQPITTVTDGALVLLIQNFTQELVSAAAPSGYTVEVSEPGVTANNGRHLFICSKIKATAGTETPGVYGHVDDATPDADTRMLTIAFRPSAAVAAAGFDSQPSVSSRTDTAYTVAYEGNATAATLYAGAYRRGATAPTAAELKAGTGALAVASEACTGNPDTITLTVTESPPYPFYDLYFVVEDGSLVLSTVVALTSEPLNPITDWQHVTVNVPSPLGSYSVLDGASPAIVDGDVIRCPETLSPGGFALHMDQDGTYWFLPGFDDTRQYFDVQVYDVDVGEWTALVRDYVNNPGATYDGETSFLVPVDEDVGTTLAIAAGWNHVNGDALTVEWLDALPAGLADDAGSISGTPTAQGTYALTSQATDVTGDTVTIDIDIVVGVRLPDVRLVEQSLAEAGLIVVGPSLTVNYADGEYSDTVALGAVISQDPPAGSVVDPTETVTLTVSLGVEPVSPGEEPEEPEPEFDGWHLVDPASNDWTPV